jgi:lipid II:glycine glycyltransferase (peptidoglycan interpeptide bridge formation enzyme)
VISGVLSFYYQDTVLPYYAASRMEFRKYAPNDFQYWSLMEHAVGRGCRYFDYGRSKKGTGPFQFKVHWGFEPIPLHYQFYLNRLEELPNLNPLNPKHRLKIEMWKKLPKAVAKVLGPRIVKYIP